MKNDNPLIILRNKAILWISLTTLGLVGIWWVHSFFSASGAGIQSKVTTLSASLVRIKEEGIITEKDITPLSVEEKKNERWITMTRLVPTLTKLVGIGTPAAAKNIATMKTISQKVGGDDYISWLQKSWTGEAQTQLTQTQADIAEVIPVFAGAAEMSSTESIGGKITLKSLVDYIQANIVDQFALGNALGSIGISSVKFLPDTSDIGIYEVPLQFEKVPNENIIELLKFLGKTGDVVVSEGGNNLSIQHITSHPLAKKSGNESSLKNLLITVKDLIVIPSALESEGPSAADTSITTLKKSFWDVRITLNFYIRGASRDHITNLDQKITTLLDKSGKNGSLIAKGNDLLKACNNCAESAQVKDIISLLGSARSAYDSILIEEKNVKKDFTPIEILEHRTGIMTTLETLQNKLTALESLIAPTQ